MQPWICRLNNLYPSSRCCNSIFFTAVPARTGRGEPITAAADRSPGEQRAAGVVEGKSEEWESWWGLRG
jgi:hypothetical protein